MNVQDNPINPQVPVDEKTSELLKALDIMMRDITPEQIEKLKKLSQTIDPQNLKPEEALRIVKESGIDIEELQKRSRVKRFLNRPKKIPPNSPCVCGSQKKYKKCCGQPGNAPKDLTNLNAPTI